MIECNDIKAIVFDAFGTVVKPVDRSAGYRTILSKSQDLRQGRRMALTKDVDMVGLASLLQVEPPLQEHLDQLEVEVAGIEPYEDTLPTIEALRALGKQVAICSNLAAPYGPTVRQLLPMVDDFIFSYEVGFLKPEQGIYDAVCERLGVEPHEVLFIGDTPLADVEGPTKAGMKAQLIRRQGGDSLMKCLRLACSCLDT